MNETTKKYLAILATALVVAIVAVVIYVEQLNRAVADNVLMTVQEISEHDVKSVEASVDISFDRLEALGARLQYSNFNSLSELQENLSLEDKASSVFNGLYLLDTQGRLYSPTKTGDSPSEHIYDDIFPANEDRFIMRLDEQSGIPEESLVYGVRIPNFKVAGIEFCTLIGSSSINVFRDQLQIESFDGRGYSSVINQHGYYIINANASSDASGGNNFYQTLTGATFSDGMTLDSISQNIKEEKAFLVDCTFSNGEKQVFSFAPISGTSWSFVMAIPSSVFNERFTVFITLTIIMMVVVILAVTLMAALVLRYFRNSIEANARAQAHTDFLSNMSHEIRTPLNGIIGLNHLMKNHLDDKDRLREYTTKMGETAQYLLSLVNNILDFSKFQAGKINLSNERFSLPDLVETLCQMQRENISSRGIDFVCTQEISYPYLIGDQMRIKQVIMNVLSNAAKFTPSGGFIVFHVWQEAGTEPNQATTYLQVRDTGCGMSEEFLSRVFDVFAQEHTLVHEDQKGTGLGMPISNFLMNHMGGSLIAESKLGEGSCFTAKISLPIGVKEVSISTEALRPEPPFKNEEMTASENHSVKRILVAEDNELNAEILITILKEEGYVCSHATTGEEAVALFTASKPGSYSAILMDAQMPVMDGYEAARAIRSLNRPDAQSVKIFACTASTFKEDRDKAESSGMSDFLAKPIDVSLMLKMLSED